MQFAKSGDWYSISRITGPTHNLLRIRFGDQDIEPTIDKIAGDIYAPTGLVAEDIRHEVIAGVAEANATLGTSYFARAIGYVPSDTPPVSIYRYLAKSLVEHLASGGEFEPGLA